jgi:hypothetical protein
MFRSTGKAVNPFVLPGLRTALETVKSVVPLPFVASAVDVALNVVTAIEVRPFREVRDTKANTNWDKS